MKIQILILSLIGIATQITYAHPVDVALVKLSPQPNEVVAVDLEVNPAFAGELLNHPIASGPLSEAETKSLFWLTLGNSRIDRANVACVWREDSLTATRISEQSLSLHSEMKCPAPGIFQMRFDFVKKLSPSFQLIVQLKERGREQLAGADSSKTEIAFEETPKYSMKEFVAMGITHIGASPSEWRGPEGWKIPEGIDHILFVIALLLASAALLDIFKVVTGFTIGHSITLALGALNLIHLPSQFVEAAIALSIAVVAGEALFLKKSKSRWRIAFAFGIVHGLGFATALTELQLQGRELMTALVGFNVGVELGQAIIVAVAFPSMWYFRNAKLYVRGFRPAIATLILALGSFWFLERALGG